MMKKLAYILSLIILLGAEYVEASSNFFFKKYKVENGLSHNTVLCGLQDSYGFIWLGTSNGLNCYDGNSNIVYRNMLNEIASFENDNVDALLEEDHNIWIGANYGLYIYNRFANRFSRFATRTRYGVNISTEVREIIKARNGSIWICTLGQGLFIYNPTSKALYQNSARASYICDACQGNDNNIYLSSMQGSILQFKENGQFVREYKIAEYLDNKINNCIRNINGEIWLGAGSNLYHLNQQKGIIEKFDTNSFFGSIHSLLSYSRQEMLVGTDKGLYLFSFISKLYRRIDNPADPRSLSDQTINDMMWDREGSLWVMTNLGGVNYMSKQSTQFNYFPLSHIDGNNDNTEKVVSSFCEAKDGNIWIGTQSGLYLYNASSQKIAIYGGDKLKYDIRTIMLDGDKLWVGTNSNGIRVVDTKTGNIKAYTHSQEIPYTICSNDVFCIYKDKRGDIYIGTNWGLCRYNAKSDRFMTITNIGSMVSISDLLEDESNNLWIASSNYGVLRWNLVTNEWSHFIFEKNNPTSITSNSIITLFEDSHHNIWFGTNGGGLCFFNAKTNHFTNFDPNYSIIPNSIIYAIEQDREGNFWVSSNLGLTRFNPTTKQNIHQYTLENDLQGSQFTQHSSLKTNRGEMFFGSINGFSSFFPENLKGNKTPLPVYITNISFPYSNNALKEKERLHLDKPLYTEDEISIPYEENSFTIHFVAISYENPSQLHYSYILKGIDKHWVQNAESNTATYTNLPPGKYEFLIRCSNNDSNVEPTSLKIVVTPPWYRSMLAYIIYFILLVVILFYLARSYNNTIQNKYNRQMEEYNIKKEKEVYKSKIRFFINLVHEIRTPLSLIRLPLEKLQENKHEEKEDRYISTINKNVDYLLNITNQLLDFQKIEDGVLQLVIKKCSINSIVEDIYNQFAESAELRNLHLETDIPQKELFAAVDSEKISKILVNLMGNALKYTNHTILLRLSFDSTHFEISVNDDGPGIPDKEKEKIFETFYQVHGDKIAAASGTGIGLSFAKLLAEAHEGTLRVEDNEAKGSSFILSIPIKAEEQPQPENNVVKDIIQDSNKDDSFSELDGKGFTILLVEDNIDLLNLTRDSLQDWYRVLKARNGVEALDTLSYESVDVIISDIMMPEMDGLELCNKIKNNIDYSHIPIILLTAKTTIEAKVEGLQSGADVYIEKPFSIKQLHLQIENLLRLRMNFHKQMSSLIDSQTDNPISTEFALTQKDCEFVEKLQSLLAERLADENFSIDTLSEKMNMSRSSFYRKIKALSGLSPNDYMKTIRMNRAAELMKQGIRINEVAEQVGFTSSSYFAKCFKAQFGVLPKDYLR
jgi:signal transduction histidine kinase/ligand-binding sensor domain-containing protein/DNA-binding response OmpR family regulator